MFRFENTQAFNFFWLLLAVLIIRSIYEKYFNKQVQKSINSRLLPFLTQSVSRAKRKWKLVLQVLVLSFMIMALARPQSGSAQAEIKSSGIEIMLAVDVSESMLAEDVRPSRLEQAKTELSKLVDLMPGNKMGVIAFAGSAALLSPLTNDPGAVKMYIDSLSTESVSSQGTNFSALIDLAIKAFERGGVTKDESNEVNRIIIIASDGEDQEQGALDRVSQLSKEGVRVFTIAYGTEKGGAIPTRDGMGFLKGYKKDRAGNTILTTVKGDFLRQLAQAGQGSFYFSVFGGDHLKQIVEDVNKIEKTEFESKLATQYEENFQIFLVFAFVFGLIEVFLGDRRNSFKLWKGRFEVPPA